jgi:hypothetical protein
MAYYVYSHALHLPFLLDNSASRFEKILDIFSLLFPQSNNCAMGTEETSTLTPSYSGLIETSIFSPHENREIPDVALIEPSLHSLISL